MDRASQKYTKEFARLTSTVIHGKSRVYFSKVTIDVRRGWRISFEQIAGGFGRFARFPLQSFCQRGRSEHVSTFAIGV